ncbi:MAG: SPASM domain-containing protein [Deltaproteobacteria bacterium]|nr:SPASM domain-containing protein [Deltaproteobacteria bacterium]
MLDSFRYRTLQVEVATACNLDCAICLRKGIGRPNKFLSLSDFKRILDPGLFRYVGLHGWGEPLLNRRTFEMVEYARSKGVVTNLTTNGTLIQDRTDEILGSGLEEIAFGIYDPDLLSNVLPDIEGFIGERNKRSLKVPKAYFDITLYQENQDRIPDLIRSASDVGIEAIIIHRLFNLYGVDSKAECLSAEDEKDLFKEIRKIARSLKIELYLPKRHSYPCLIVKRSIFVTVDGKVTPCTYLPEEHLGDALQEGVKHILSSKRYRDFVNAMKQHPICGKCRW